MISDICLKSQLFFECMYWQDICTVDWSKEVGICDGFVQSL